MVFAPFLAVETIKEIKMTQIATIEQHKDFEVLVDPKEFGIETGDDKRVLITDVFAFYEKEYNEIVGSSEITSTCD